MAANAAGGFAAGVIAGGVGGGGGGAGGGEVEVNLGGEGEVPGAINVQGPWTMDANWRSVGGETLPELAAKGDPYVVADNQALPFRGGIR
jgi:hypothetical protein